MEIPPNIREMLFLLHKKKMFQKNHKTEKYSFFDSIFDYEHNVPIRPGTINENEPSEQDKENPVKNYARYMSSLKVFAKDNFDESGSDKNNINNDEVDKEKTLMKDRKSVV